MNKGGMGTNTGVRGVITHSIFSLLFFKFSLKTQ